MHLDVPVLVISIAPKEDSKQENWWKPTGKRNLDRTHKNFEPILNDVQKYCNWMDIFIDRRKWTSPTGSA